MLNTPKLYDFITQNTLTSNYNFHTCIKQSVHAMIVSVNEEIVYGLNKTENYVAVCPRVELNMKSGEGYDLCQSVCKQGAHAEVDAVANAIKSNIDLTDSILYLTGHTYCCDNCLKEMTIANIKQVYIIGENNEIIKEYTL